METKKNNSQNKQNNAIANQTENKNSENAISLTPPENNFSLENTQEQIS